MRPHNRAALAAALSLGIALSANAAESSDLYISGTIRPSACTISLSPGTIDYGTIPAGALSETALTPLPNMPFSVTISCDAPTVAALAFGDNRAGSEGDPALASETWFGLGEIDGKPLGAFQLVRTSDSVTANGDDVGTIEYTRSNSWLQMNLDYPQVSARSGYLLSWSAAGTVPLAYRNVVVPLAVRPMLIGKQNMPSLNDVVPLDGLATISLVYL